jgi:hypothetical protein
MYKKFKDVIMSIANVETISVILVDKTGKLILAEYVHFKYPMTKLKNY